MYNVAHGQVYTAVNAKNHLISYDVQMTTLYMQR